MNISAERIKVFIVCLPILLAVVLFSCDQQSNKEILLGKISSINFEDILKIDGTVQAVRSSTLSCPRRINGNIVSIIKDGTMVEKGDVVCVLQNRELENQYDQLLIDVENAKASLNKCRADLNLKYAMLDAQVKSIVAQTAIANLDSLQLKYASPKLRRIKELELKKADIEKTKLERKLKALEIINRSEIRSLEIQIMSSENRAKDMKERLEMMTLKATQAGLAIRADSWITGKKVQEGDQVWSSMPLITIPELSEMKVIISASEVSYKRIDVNDRVEFSFDAMPGNRAWGKILSKAPVGQPVSEKSKVKFFEIEASIDSSLALPEPGLTAVCNVVLQRVMDTIVVPQIAIFDEDSMKFVFVKLTREYEKRQVLLGSSSPKNAVIVKGLTGEERISLIKPSSSHVKLKTLLPDSNKKKSSAIKKRQRNISKINKTQPKQIHLK